MDLKDALRFISSLIPLITSIIKARSELQSWKTAWYNAEIRIGNLGFVYRIIWKYSQRFFHFLLLIILIISVISLFTGTILVYNLDYPDIDENKQTDQANLFAYIFIICKSLFEYSPYTVLIYIILAIVIHLNVFQSTARIFIKFINKKTTFQPGYCNATWQSQFGTDFNPINTSKEYINMEADECIEYVKTRRPLLLHDRAQRESDLEDARCINALLFGNLIEGELWKRDDLRNQIITSESGWNKFYQSFQHLEIFDPEFIKSHKESLYAKATERADHIFIDHIGLKQKFNDVAKLLANKYDGNALYLTVRFPFWWFRDYLANHPVPFLSSNQIAIKRILNLYTGEERETVGPNGTSNMTFQFMKVANRWNIWENHKTKNLFYPDDQFINISKELTVHLLNKQCLIAPIEIERIVMDKYFRRLVYWTTLSVSKRVKEKVEKSSETFFSDLMPTNLSNHKNLEFVYFELTDTILWSRAKENSKYRENSKYETSWSISGNEIKRE